MPDTANSNRDARLEQVLAEYLHSVELGAPLAEESLLAKHPDLADDLRSFFRNRAEISRLARPLQNATADDATVALGMGASSAATKGTNGTRIRYFGDYELLDEIARGGMGVVYKARQVSLNRLVALKMILAGNLAAADDVKRFQQEAESAANLDHPGIVPIYEIGSHDGQHYFSMKLIEGRSLSSELREDRAAVTPTRAAMLISQVARAVHHAHQRGVLHRDLKPGNILLDNEGMPHVTDFGLAKRVEGQSDLTQTGAIVGTPAYMAPEQAHGEKQLSTAADVYSLGAILYELLAGRPPFRGESPLETLMQVMNGEPERPSSITHGLDPDLETICLKCLEKEPERRYDSAAALADDLDRWLRGEPIEARSVTASERVWRWCRRNPVIAGLLTAVVMSLVVGIVASSMLAYEASWQAEEARWFAKNARAEEEKAKTAAKQAEANELVALENNYRSSVIQAQQHLNLGEIGGMLQALESQLPENNGGRDFRRFEWYFLNRLVHGYERMLPGETKKAEWIRYSPDGKFLAAGNYEKIWVWNPSESKLLFTLEPDKGVESDYGFQSQAILPDSKHLAVVDGGFASAAQRHAGEPLGIRVFSLPDGKLVHKFSGSELIAFSDDGSRFATLVYAPPPAEPKEGEPKPDPKLLWRKARVCEYPSGQLVGEFPIHNARVEHLAFNADGTRLGVSGEVDATSALWDKEVEVKSAAEKSEGIWARVWEVATGKPLFAYQQSSSVAETELYVAPLRMRKLVTAERLLPFPERTDRSTGLPSPSKGLWDYDTSRDGKFFVAGSWDPGVHLFDAASGRFLRTLYGHTGNDAFVAFRPDGLELASASFDPRGDGFIRLWNPHRDTEGPVFDVGLSVSSPLQRVIPSPGDVLLAFEPLQKAGAFVRAWDLRTGLPSDRYASFKLEEGVLLDTKLSQDGKSLVAQVMVNGRRSELRTIELPSGKTLNKIALTTHAFDTEGTFSPDYRFAATVQFKGDKPKPSDQLQIWSMSDGKIAKTIEIGIDRWIRPVRFSRSGRYLLANAFAGIGSQDFVVLYDLEAGKLLHRWENSEIFNPRAAFTPDESQVTICSATGWKTWETASGTLVRLKKIPNTFEGELRPDGPQAIGVLSHDGSRMVSTNSTGSYSSSRIMFWDVASGQQLLNLPAPEGYLALEFTPDDRRLIIMGYGEDSHYFRIWDGSPSEARR